MLFIMNKEKEEYVPYVPGKPVEEPKLEDFDGDWNSTLMDAFGMQMPTAAGVSDVEMKISISGRQSFSCNDRKRNRNRS